MEACSLHGVAVECSLMLWRDDARIRLGVLCPLLMALSEGRFLLAVPHSDETSLATCDNVAKAALEVVVAGEPAERLVLPSDVQPQVNELALKSSSSFT